MSSIATPTPTLSAPPAVTFTALGPSGTPAQTAVALNPAVLPLVEALPGPPGPPGPQGNPGGSATLDAFEFSGLAAGQVVDLPHVPVSLVVLLLIEGIMQSPSQSGYSVAGSNVTIPAGLLWDGAECMFVYQHS